MDKTYHFPIYEEFQEVFDYFNRELFNNTLPQCFVTLQQKTNYNGIYRGNNFHRHNEQNVNISEIGMNVDMMAIRSPIETLATFVHEMVHLKTDMLGEVGRGGYHNKKWARYMKMVGLQPFDIKEGPGGKEVGQNVTHEIVPGGKFEVAAKKFLDNGFVFPLVVNLHGKQIHYLKENEITQVDKNKFRVDGREIEVQAIYYAGQSGDNEEKLFALIEKGRMGTRTESNMKTTGTRIKYTCPCGINVWGGRDLDIMCRKCGQIFNESSLITKNTNIKI